jgi:hypothetical protein
LASELERERERRRRAEEVAGERGDRVGGLEKRVRELEAGLQEYFRQIVALREREDGVGLI